MKCNFPKKRTVYELLAIQKRWSGKKVRFWQKVCKNSLIKNKKKTFFKKVPFLNRRLLRNGLFLSIVMFHMVIVKKVIL